MTCRPAPACGVVLLEASTLWPYRSRASDGICASPQHHAQNPTSDHEPDVRGIAHAVDLTHDPVHGCDVDHVLELIVAGRDPRVKYLIRNRQIIRSYKTSPKHPEPWTPQAYTGPNPHIKHLHISIWTEHENDTSPWFSTPPVSHPDQEDFLMPAAKDDDDARRALIRDWCWRYWGQAPTAGEQEYLRVIFHDQGADLALAAITDHKHAIDHRKNAGV
jgi:hypothetical protein